MSKADSGNAPKGGGKTRVVQMEPKAVPREMWVPALVLTSACIVFVFAVFWFKSELTLAQTRILNFIFPFIAGAASFFFGGSALLKLTSRLPGIRVGFTATAGIAVFIFTYTHPLFVNEENPYVDYQGNPLGSPANSTEKALLTLHNQMLDLRQYLESADRYQESVDKLSGANKLAEQTLTFDDVKLNPRRRYMKYQDATYFYVMAAVAKDQRHNPEAQVLAMDAVHNADTALSLLQSSQKDYANSADARFLVDYVVQDNGDSRVWYLKAMALCVASKYSLESGNLRRIANVSWKGVSESYARRFPARATPQLVGCIEEP